MLSLISSFMGSKVGATMASTVWVFKGIASEAPSRFLYPDLRATEPYGCLGELRVWPEFE